MGDDVSMLTQWSHLFPTEKTGDLKEKPVVKERTHKKKEGQREGAASSEPEKEKEEGFEDGPDEKSSGKVLDIII